MAKPSSDGERAEDVQRGRDVDGRCSGGLLQGRRQYAARPGPRLHEDLNVPFQKTRRHLIAGKKLRNKARRLTQEFQQKITRRTEASAEAQ